MVQAADVQMLWRANVGIAPSADFDRVTISTFCAGNCLAVQDSEWLLYPAV